MDNMTERDYIVNNLKQIISDGSTNTTTQDKLRALDMLMSLQPRVNDSFLNRIPPYNQMYC